MDKIYKISNNINNKIYVGQTTESLTRRFKRHIGMCYREEKVNKFYIDFLSLNHENFKIELLEEVEDSKLTTDRERFWITKLDTVNNGYNSIYPSYKNGGDTLTNHPDMINISKKISDSKKYDSNPNSKRVKVIDLETGESSIFNSFSQCQEELDIPRHDIISRRCRGKITKPYRKKLMFEYID